jgi:hypothetical protein
MMAIKTVTTFTSMGRATVVVGIRVSVRVAGRIVDGQDHIAIVAQLGSLFAIRPVDDPYENEEDQRTDNEDLDAVEEKVHFLTLARAEPSVRMCVNITAHFPASPKHT